MYFLLSYYMTIKSPMSLTMDSIFWELLTKEELILIIKDMYDDSIDEHFNLQDVSTTDLLEIIGDKSYILWYIIDNWKLYQNPTPNQFTSEVVKQTLKELGIKRHLLSKKPIPQRESSDYKTFQGLLKKAGKPFERYAIVSKDIDQQNIGVFADQVELYNTGCEAWVELFRLKIEENQDIDNLKVVAI